MDLDLQNLCISKRIYDRIELNNTSDKVTCAEILLIGGSARAYCNECRNDSVFKIIPYLPKIPGPTVLGYVAEEVDLSKFNSIVRDKCITLVGECAANTDHTIVFNFHVTSTSLVKIGQYPSYTDLMRPTTSKYKKVLDTDKFKELNRAIGLASSEIGIGSFVYLRRVFEHILDTAHNEAKTSYGWNETDYQNKKVHEKIVCLKGFLPQFLVDNWTLYSILSKGIHELSEEECISYFPVVKSGIELILDELLSKEEQKRKLAEAQKAISQLHSQLKSK
ncbi:hypothetical protein [Sporomusa sphaeroides]|uniref:Nucleotidyltransferase n=1 Tax=Sporomusa sphaeroides DSM 2875 TaxID=1337886 RepID=A0ABM9VY24_9FIRM|nr:hypothetical protein [Sporomusa sphaeroides]OLS58275.1 hypothetical protein SPSPH_18110 [Sporomusa sphaeroides DSM 2875]CVK17538.1 hypothetical protein SSPH_00172 [Sporomusa sphaeroides DSM 2875]